MPDMMLMVILRHQPEEHPAGAARPTNAVMAMERKIEARIVQPSPMDTTSVATEFQTDYRWVSHLVTAASRCS